MRKLVLKCNLAPGDIVMMTAAVRDLHAWYPRKFITDVRTACPELWEHNPYLTRLSDRDPRAEHIECSYPLINRSNHAPYHCLHGFIEFLNEHLRLAIKPTAFKGDIHLADAEKVWYSQVHELTGQDTPFWIVSAGGKYDITIKWWDFARYQEVVNYFKGKIQFVQVGQLGHHHPRLDGVIDLRGKTNLRQLIRLVYHAQGVLCPVTSLMHLAAAVETKPGRPATRACVVVAGGREPAHWEAYPDHQFIHTNGALACCTQGGCWKDRAFPLRDGDPRDHPDRLCTDVRGGLPHCMDLITADEVIRRIEGYFKGGALKYLEVRQRRAAEKAVRLTATNPFDAQALNLPEASLALERCVRTMPHRPSGLRGRGIVVCLTGTELDTEAERWLTQLRTTGCRLPVQFWFLGKPCVKRPLRLALARLGADCKDAVRLRKRFPVRILQSPQLRAYALLYSRFREVLLLSSQTAPTGNPERLFEKPDFLRTGALFTRKRGPRSSGETNEIWRNCAVRKPRGPEFTNETVVVDKQRCWDALRLGLWFDENPELYHRFLSAGEETFQVAFCKLKQPYAMLPARPRR